MKNNNGKGLYEIGETIKYPCGCVAVAEVIGYTHYVNPKCKFCNTYHPITPGYRYEKMPTDSVDSVALSFLKGSL